ncbi:MAG: GHKL domain-containing protein, partial [Chlamydiae bacterium]|nr:GHKL domain-containing protein [Chlamydiota bacterium]
DRMEGLTQQLTHVGKIEKPVLAALDPRKPLQETLNLMEPKLKKGKVHVSTNFWGPQVLIEADQNQLAQVFFNLMKNAMEAMSQGGTLEIRSEFVKRDEGQFYEVTFKDSGIGMDEETLTRLFEPFYTARKEKGMGLGLSISRQLVEAQGGKIQVQSALGQGTTMSVVLPVGRS